MGKVQRRMHRRAEVGAPALLMTIASRFDGVLEDISESGARILLRAKPPREGRDVVVRWSDHEAFGMVVWASAERVGIAFHQNLPSHMVIHPDENDGPEDLEPYVRNFRPV